MRVVIDTNIVFSAILKTNSLIARIILHPGSRLNLYSTNLLLNEILEHKDKIKRLGSYSHEELDKTITLVTSKIRFIDANLIPTPVFLNSERLLEDIDIDDTEFVALTTHIKGKLWSGDKVLQKGLLEKGWNKFITTEELYQLIFRKTKP